MDKSISIDHLVAARFPDEKLAEELAVLLDTNTLRYNFSPVKSNNYRVVMTLGVIVETLRHEKIFPYESVERLKSILNPQIPAAFVSSRNEEIILRAHDRNRKPSRPAGGIGWADIQQIGYVLNQARGGRKVLVVSNDKDITNTIAALQEDFKFMRNNSSYVSIEQYIKQKHAKNLKGIRSPFRHGLFKEIESHYLINSA